MDISEIILFGLIILLGYAFHLKDEIRKIDVELAKLKKND
jgi:hypothetical protein